MIPGTRHDGNEYHGYTAVKRVEHSLPFQPWPVTGQHGDQKNPGSGETIALDDLLVFYGLTPDLGPIADWGLNLDKKNIDVEPETCATNIRGIYAIGDINSYPGKKKLILTGFNEAVLTAYAVQKYLDPSVKQSVQYTTTSSTLQKRLGVAES